MDARYSEENKPESIAIFCCYAHEDEELLNKLKVHLSPLQHQGLITVWYDRNISAGAVWQEEIKRHLSEAHIILLLISSDFMNSQYCYSVEMQHALERHKNGKATVIPIILRHTYWHEGPLGTLLALPTDGKPVTNQAWDSPDQAFYTIVVGIRSVVEAYMAKEEHRHKAEQLEQVHSTPADYRPAKVTLTPPIQAGTLKKWPERKLSRRTVIASLAIAGTAGIGGGTIWWKVFSGSARASSSGPMSWTNHAPILGQSSLLAPALATLNDTLYLAFVANDGSNNLLHTSSSDHGQTWSNVSSIGQQASKTAPALALLSDGTIHLVYVANNKTNNLLYTSSSDNFKTGNNVASTIWQQSSKTAPALAVLNNTLYLAFVANYGSNQLSIVSSSDHGYGWSNVSSIGRQASKTAPTLALSSDGTSHLVYVANNRTSNLLYTSSSDNFKTGNYNAFTIGQQSSLLAPALAVLNDTLYLAFVANDGSNNLLYTSSSDHGQTWSNVFTIGQLSSKTAPALAVLDNTLYLAFVANDGSNQLCVVSSTV